MSLTDQYDEIIRNYQWRKNFKAELQVITFKTTNNNGTYIYIAAIVPKKSHFNSILASSDPDTTLNDVILLNGHSTYDSDNAILNLLAKTRNAIGEHFLAINDSTKCILRFRNHEEIEKYRQELTDSLNNDISTESSESTLVSDVGTGMTEHSRMINELQKKCETLEKKCDSLEKKNEELERRVITDIGSSIAEALHTKTERLIAESLSQLTDSNLSLLEKERMVETSERPLERPGHTQPDHNAIRSQTMMTPNSSAVSDTDITITSIPGLENAPETSTIGTWNKIRSVDKQLGWLYSTGVLGDDRMKRYIRQDLKQLADDINAYLDENK